LFKDLRQANPGEDWKCPEVKNGRVRAVKTAIGDVN